VGETFFEGGASVTDEERSGWPATSRTEENITKIHQIVHENCRLTVRSIAEQVNIDRETVRKILTEDLDMRKVCAKMVPKELTKEQNQRRVTVCQDLLEKQDDILGPVITGDETQVYQYDPEMKWQSAEWKTANSPQPKNFCQSKSRVKTMLLAFFYIRGIVHYEFVPTGQSTRFTIWKYWEGCVKKLDGNDPDFLPTTHGSCITTMHLLTQHCLWGSF